MSEAAGAASHLNIFLPFLRVRQGMNGEHFSQVPFDPTLMRPFNKSLRFPSLSLCGNRRSQRHTRLLFKTRVSEGGRGSGGGEQKARSHRSWLGLLLEAHIMHNALGAWFVRHGHNYRLKTLREKYEQTPSNEREEATAKSLQRKQRSRCALQVIAGQRVDTLFTAKQICVQLPVNVVLLEEYFQP